MKIVPGQWMSEILTVIITLNVKRILIEIKD